MQPGCLLGNSSAINNCRSLPIAPLPGVPARRHNLLSRPLPPPPDTRMGKKQHARQQCSPVDDWNVTQAGQSRVLESATGAGGAAHRPDVSVVLVHPQIPQNTGNIARSCAATNVALHLVGPLGFELDDKKLKRAGLDYWEHVCVKVHDSWEAFFAYFQSLPGQQRLIGYTVYGDSYYAGPEFSYQAGDWLLFGAETTGLPMQAHEDIVSSGGRLVKIPIQDTYVRSLNQSVCVGVGLFEALRQLDTGSHNVTPRDDASSPAVKRPTLMQKAQQPQQQEQQSQQQQQQQQALEGAVVERELTLPC